MPTPALSWMKKMLCLLLVLLPGTALSGIRAHGSYAPVPLQNGDGVVTSEMRLGEIFQSSGSVSVTNGDTLTTQESSYLAYTTFSSGSVSLTDSTWIAESAVFMAMEFWGDTEVTLNNSYWNLESNMKIAYGEGSQAIITLTNNSTWDLEFSIMIAMGEDAIGTIHLQNSTWNASGVISVSGDYAYPGDGYGTLHIGTNGVLNSQAGLNLYPLGRIEMDGGDISLAGETILEGTFEATSNGGDVIVFAGPAQGIPGLTNIGTGVNFAGCSIDIQFHPDHTPDPSTTYNLFDPIDEADLTAILTTADSITTPAWWVLNLADGTLHSTLNFSDCVTGPGIQASPECSQSYDSDGDQDVDLKDFAVYQQNYTG